MNVESRVYRNITDIRPTKHILHALHGHPPVHLALPLNSNEFSTACCSMLQAQLLAKKLYCRSILQESDRVSICVISSKGTGLQNK